MDKVSTSLEDYLKALVTLGATPEHGIKPSDLAREVGVSKPSACKALSVLREKGYVEQPYYGDATLTEEGLEYGRGILKRHTYLYAFLTHELGISPELAEDEAHKMEHAISEESFEKWAAFIESRGFLDE